MIYISYNFSSPRINLLRVARRCSSWSFVSDDLIFSSCSFLVLYLFPVRVSFRGGGGAFAPPLLDVCPPLKFYYIYILYSIACSACHPWYAKTAILPSLKQNPKCCPASLILSLSFLCSSVSEALFALSFSFLKRL